MKNISQVNGLSIESEQELVFLNMGKVTAIGSKESVIKAAKFFGEAFEITLESEAAPWKEEWW